MRTLGEALDQHGLVISPAGLETERVYDENTQVHKLREERRELYWLWHTQIPEAKVALAIEEIWSRIRALEIVLSLREPDSEGLGLGDYPIDGSEYQRDMWIGGQDTLGTDEPRDDEET